MVVVWEEMLFFLLCECVVFKFIEDVMFVVNMYVLVEVYEVVVVYFLFDEMGVLISLIVMINVWNMFVVMIWVWVFGSYEV